MIDISVEIVDGKCDSPIVYEVTRIPCVGEYLITHIDCQPHQVLEVIHHLNPFNWEDRNGETYAAIVRVK